MSSEKGKLGLVAFGLSLLFVGSTLAVLLSGTDQGPATDGPVVAKGVNLPSRPDESNPLPPRTQAAPSAPKRSQTDWSHQELVDHLNRGGKEVDKSPASPMKQTNGVAVWLIRTSVAWAHNRALAAAEGHWSAILFENSGVIHCQKHPTEEAARDVAGTSNMAFAWGRFTFRGDPLFLDWLKVALKS